MKPGKVLLTGLIGAAPVACGMIVSACAFPTAFKIGFSLVPLILFCVAASLLLSFWMTAPKYGFGFGALYIAGVILLVVFCLEHITDGANAFAYRTLEQLSEAVKESFDMEELSRTIEKIDHPDLCISLLLMTVVAGIGIPLAYALLRSKMSALAILIPLPPILVSFAYTDMPPEMWVILLFAIYCGYALLGTGFKKGASPQRGLFLALLAPVLVMLAFLIWKGFFPEERFDAIPEDTRQELFSDVFGGVGDSILKQLGNTSPEEIRLDEDRERENGTQTVFSVKSDHAGTYHLRVRSYGAYTGRSWVKLDEKEYRGEWKALEALGNRQRESDAKMEIRGFRADERIVPYAFLGDDVITHETYVEARARTDYSWRYTQSYSIEPHPVTDAERSYYAFAREHYTMTQNSAQKQALLAIAEAEGIRAPSDPEKDVYAVYGTALDVAEYVRNSAEYDLHSTPPPEGQDAVLYFLTQEHKGSCVQFASATTAILQALGIPARYTSGFYVPNVGSEWRDVPENAKHAWAEIYLCGVGWIPIESTRGFQPNPPLSVMEQREETPTEPTASQTPQIPIPFLPTAVPNEPEPIEPEPVPLPQRTPKPEIPPVPGESSETPEEVSPKPKEKRGAWWLMLLLIPAVPGVWIGVGILVRKRREARFADPNVRRAIPEMAFYLKRLERYGIEADPDAERWAIEAAFSDHKMQEERKELKKRVRAAQKAVYRDRPVRRFLLKWVRFVL